MFLNVYNFILGRDPGNKQFSLSDDSKSCAFVAGNSEQQFKIQYHFENFDPEKGEKQLYDNAAPQDIRCMCELFGKICFLYSMKSILYIYKSLDNAELIYITYLVFPIVITAISSF